MEHLTKLVFNDISELTGISKVRYKRTVRDYIQKKNEQDLLGQIKQYKKLDYNEMKQEPYERKQYFYNMNLEDARFAFRISSKMLDLKKNFSHKYKRKNMSLTCELCRVIDNEDDNQEQPEESQFHLANECQAFSDLRSQTDFSDDQQLVAFFKAVMEKRSNLTIG